MVSSAAATVKQYLDELPPDRRAVVSRVRAAVNKAMPKGYEEGMLWGMIAWYVPLKRYPDTYNKQPLAYVALAAQKNKYSLYLMGVYGEKKQEQALKAAFDALGRKPDMGKSCLRFADPAHIPLDAIQKLIAAVSVDQYLEHYEKAKPKQ